MDSGIQPPYLVVIAREYTWEFLSYFLAHIKWVSGSGRITINYTRKAN